MRDHGSGWDGDRAGPGKREGRRGGRRIGWQGQRNTTGAGMTPAADQNAEQNTAQNVEQNTEQNRMGQRLKPRTEQRREWRKSRMDLEAKKVYQLEN